MIFQKLSFDSCVNPRPKNKHEKDSYTYQEALHQR